MLNKHLFLKQLRLQLRGMPTDEIEVIIQDYEDYFFEAMKNGLSEEAVVKQLGQPKEIANNIRATNRGKMNKSLAASPAPARSTIIMVALIIFNIVVVLGPVIGVCAFIFAMIIAGGAFCISPLLAIWKLVFQSGHLFEFFISLILAGIGMLILPFFINLAKKFMNLLKKYVYWNIKQIRGDTNE